VTSKRGGAAFDEAARRAATSTLIYGKSEAIPEKCQFVVMADLTVFSADTIALLGARPRPYGETANEGKSLT
jgi:hypothetical protein